MKTKIILGIVFGLLIVGTALALQFDYVGIRDITLDVSDNVIANMTARNLSNYRYYSNCLNDICTVRIFAYKGDYDGYVGKFEFDKHGMTPQEAIIILEGEIKQFLIEKYNPKKELMQGSITFT